jgi:GxxExxY protein
MQFDLKHINLVTDKIIGGGMRVHSELGPGLLESAYLHCLSYELEDMGLAVVREKPLPLTYRGRELDCGYRLDLVIEDLIVVEIKAVEVIAKIHEAQNISYLKLSGYPFGLLMNFHTLLLKDRLRRLANPTLKNKAHPSL